MKVIKILKQKPCIYVSKARVFIRVCIYYYIQIKGFIIIAKLIYIFFRKNTIQIWGLEQDLVINTLKIVLTQILVLAKINYSERRRNIILALDTSLKGQGVVFIQLDTKGQKYLLQYKSRLQNKVEIEYNTTKREYCIVLKVLQKVRYQLYRIYFILETDTNILVVQLN